MFLLSLDFRPFVLQEQNVREWHNLKLALGQNAILQFSARFPDCQIHCFENLWHQKQSPFSYAIRDYWHTLQMEHN